MMKSDDFEIVLSKEERANLIKQINHDSSSLSDEQLIQLILSFGFREKDLKKVWKKAENDIIDPSIFMDIDALCMCFGSRDEKSAAFFKTIKRIIDASDVPDIKIGSICFVDDFGPFFRDYIGGELIENLCVAYLSGDDRLLGIRRYTNLEHSYVQSRVMEIVKEAISRNAYKVVIAHNHSSGSLFCSNADYRLTKSVGAELNAAGIILEEHFIVTKIGYVGILKHSFGVLKDKYDK